MKLDPIALPIEILTPAWATGGNQQQAEIRIPTIRGQLRLWLRLVYSGQGLDNAIFGSVDTRKAQASLVSLRLKSQQAAFKVQNLEDYTGKTGDAALHDPEAYFLWPLRPTRESQQKRGVICPPTPSRNANFLVEVMWLPPSFPQRSRLEPALQQAMEAFSLLGAFGTRSTRGYGSVWPDGLDLGNPADLAAKLSFLPDSISVRLLPGYGASGRQALAAAAKWFRSLRLGTARFGGTPTWGRNDHDVALKPTADEVLYRAALGLPLAQNYRSGTRLQTKYRWRDPVSGRETWNDRYPSPVRFKVVRIAGQYGVLVVLLRDQLLPEAIRLRVEERGRAEGEVQLSHALFAEIANTGEAIH